MKTNYKVTNQDTGFIYYFNEDELKRFRLKNDSPFKYNFEIIKSFDYINFISMILTYMLISSLTLLYIYYATS